MATSPVVQPSEDSYNPAKSWKIVLVLAPIIIVVGALIYKSQTPVADVHAAVVRPMSAADGRVHVVSPKDEVDSEYFDGNVTWQPYPNAASYDVEMFRVPGIKGWKESTKVDHITLHTEFFPPWLKNAIDANTSVGYSVVARDAAGKIIADSGPQYFYLKIPPQSGFGN
jgi:hypothetical protein